MSQFGRTRLSKGANPFAKWMIYQRPWHYAAAEEDDARRQIREGQPMTPMPLD
jgi:hypothetical protein